MCDKDYRRGAISAVQLASPRGVMAERQKPQREPLKGIFRGLGRAPHSPQAPHQGESMPHHKQLP